LESDLVAACPVRRWKRGRLESLGGLNMKRSFAEGLLCAALLAAAVAVFTTPSTATTAYMKTEKAKNPAVKSCAYCHVKNGSKDLNATGDCYGKDKRHSLEGCPGPDAPKPAAAVLRYLSKMDHAAVTQIAE
jgi:hypothetical protein